MGITPDRPNSVSRVSTSSIRPTPGTVSPPASCWAVSVRSNRSASSLPKRSRRPGLLSTASSPRMTIRKIPVLEVIDLRLLEHQGDGYPIREYA